MQAAASKAARDWIKIPRPLKSPKARLVCFPHAGAGASAYYSWVRELEAADVELRAIQYPGREDRIRETPISSCSAMVETLAEIWPSLAPEGPYAIFGHSMGALVGCELVRKLVRRQSANLPCHLFLSGRNPPHAPSPVPSIYELPDETFLRQFILDHKASLAPEILANREMLSILVPILRADVALVETYTPETMAPCDLPLTIFGGAEDHWTNADSLAEWQSYTTKRIRLQIFSGDHFFHQSERGRIISSLLSDLLPSTDGRSECFEDGAGNKWAGGVGRS